ncbi:MAG: ATP-binding protein [Deltaproteobacteria bacterium]|nr:ATP-binding protein [Deltaproteobacteria bacterium]
MQDRMLTNWISSVNKSVLLLGPRQVGKSTLVKQLEPDVYVNLAVESFFLAYAKDPDLLRRELEANRSAALIAIDEIQRVPALLNSVQVLIDEGMGRRRFLLTGSSARKLRQSSVNLLPGRVILAYLDPLMISELGDQFELERALRVGTLPGIFLDREMGEETLGSYAELYLREEVRAESLMRNVGDYARFLDTAALLSGQWINYSKVSSDTEIPKETIRRFFSILEDTLLIHRLCAFKPREKSTRRVSQRDRFIFFDVGVRNAILGIHGQKLSEEQKGSLFEQFMITQLISLGRAMRKNWSFSAYRTNAGAEVDLVIEREDDIIGLEIKYGTRLSTSQTTGLESFAEYVGSYKPVKKWICYRGDKPQRFNNGCEAYNYRDLFLQLMR